MKQSKTIVFIHGLFVNNKSWAAWKTYFEAQGYTVHTPANPGHDGVPSDLRANIHPDLTKTGFEDVVMNIVKLIDTLPEKPIVVGHSLAGLVVLKLIEMGKAVAGINIDGAPPKNVLAPFSTIKIVYPVVDFFKGQSPFLGSRNWYKRAFFNNMSEAEAAVAYEEAAVPESRKIARETLLKSFANVDFSKPHQPLLFITGEQDNIFSPALTKKITSRYKDKNSIVDYKEFKGRSHYIAGQKGWEEVADYVINWIENVGKRVG
ncbi:2-succinyl-6-hydroxy-2, 4-cyclohexadiene-1-carboxylate synthase [Dyadobacter sp. CECT 9275]|uniref:2-succinyl-6-hydroxy-2, 4-cyclohexadiene-1-carboxylate synthase n=1 Tax=Dyadobacter helix TaxID=2822344 RepID=A0A916NL87_9BACT|nr:alpha/beta hydrolase [Dyadobacter sp. CECT 9275]CAG4999564.1 2-succinyl-6-hydroxy-2, 4-cyclohexadiene-1-carboxylate synthase [Dyadobacter sp. CECT 9275]